MTVDTIWMNRPFQAIDGTVHHGFSLDSLSAVVDAYASFYYGAGVRSKDVIGVYVDEGVANLIHYMALNAIGAIPAIANGYMPVRIAANWFQRIGALGLFTDESRLAIMEHLEGNRMPLFCLTQVGARVVFNPAFPGTVYRLQTEEFLLKHFPEVADLSVVATQGGKFAEVTAIVRLKPGAKADETKLLKMFNEKLQSGGKVELDAVLFA